jgi:hypothetical protein
MMNRNKLFDFRTAYIDLLLNVFTAILFIYILSTTLQNLPKKEEEGLRKNAEYVITTEWSPDIDCDIDMWVRDPAGNVVYFNQREKGVMYLDRDDRGGVGEIVSRLVDKITGKKEYIMVKENKEIWTLRGKFPGRYQFNLHLYSCRVSADQPFIQPGQTTSVPVKLIMIKINPSYETIREETVTFTKGWQEIVGFNFTINEDGNVELFDKDYEKLVNDVRDTGVFAQ